MPAAGLRTRAARTGHNFIPGPHEHRRVPLLVHFHWQLQRDRVLAKEAAYGPDRRPAQLSNPEGKKIGRSGRRVGRAIASY